MIHLINFIFKMELSSCEYADNYYVNYLLKMNPTNELSLEVDRGVCFDTLGYLLEPLELSSLTLHQNYSTSSVDDFLNFIKLLKLKTLTLVDDQSDFLKNIKVKDLISSLPMDCNYTIIYGDEDLSLIYKKDNKKLTLIGL